MPWSSYAQTPPSSVDSLLNVLETAHDTAKTKIFIELSRDYNLSDNKKSRKYALAAISHAEKSGNKAAVGHAHNALAATYFYEGEFDKAIQTWKRALVVFEEVNNLVLQSNVWHNIGHGYSEKGEYGTAIAYFEKAYALADEADHDIGRANAYTSIGSTSIAQGDYSEAQTFLNAALIIQEKLGDRNRQAEVYNNLGTLNLELKRLDKSISNHQNALFLYEKTENAFGQAYTQELMGRVYQKEGNTDLALSHLNTAIEYYEKVNFKKGIATSMNSYGAILFSLGRQEEAMEKYEVSYTIFDSISDQEGRCKVLNNMILLHADQGLYQQAEFEGMIALTSATNSRSLTLVNQTQNTMYQLYQKWDKPEEALKFLEMYNATRDSLFELNVKHEMSRVELSENLLEQEAENKLLKKRRFVQQAIIEQREAGERRQWIATVSLSVGFTILLILAFFLVKNIRKANLQNRLLLQQKIEILQQKSEIQKQNDVLANQNEEITKQRSEIEAQQTDILKYLEQLKSKEDELLDEIKVKQMLLQEIHHRVKNNLQVISSLLNLQSNYVEDHQTLEVIRGSINRIRSMSLIHQNLYQQKDFVRSDFSKYVHDLARNLVDTYQREEHDVHLEIDVKDIQLSLDDSVPCGLILNELISNALKYAFVEKKQGSVRVSMHISDKKYHLEVSDNGSGFPADFDPENSDSLGIELVTTLTEQLDGELNMSNENGARVVITWPVVEKDEADTIPIA